jgi:triacylglycerol esterase/lipase EstA (alpha/beta hydrolase family)
LITAVTLAALYLLGATAYAAWGMHAIAQGAPWVLVALGAVAAYFAVPFVAVTYWFAMAWTHRSPRPPDKRIGWWRVARCFLTEVRCIAGSPVRMGFLWWVMREPAPAAATAPVLLLHGVGCNAGVWYPFMQRLRERGASPLYTLSYGPPLGSIDAFAVQMAAKVDAIVAATGAAKVTLLCHSMGGLVARAYLRRYGAVKVRALVTIGTPHRGSILAGMFPGTCLAEMRPGGEWLERLNRDAPPAGVRCVALWSWHDSMVIPQLNARWDGAEDVEFVGIAHNALLADAGVRACVAGLLAKVQADAAAESPPQR